MKFNCSWKHNIFLYGAALIITLHLSHALFPLRNQLHTLSLPDGWMGATTPGNRAYFRYTFQVPFKAHRAWIALAADDYQLFVNGYPIAKNNFSTNNSHAFQHKMTNALEGLNAYIPYRVQKPVLMRAHNQEWRMAHFHDISFALQKGNNVIAIFVQSGETPRLAVQGQIYGDGQELDISGSNQLWRISTTSDYQNNLPWFSLDYVDHHWPFAHFLGNHPDTIYTTLPPSIWRHPFPAHGFTGLIIGNEMRLATKLPQRIQPALSQSSWLRIHSTWPYTLFVDDEIIGQGNNKNDIELFDLTRYLHLQKNRLSLRLHAPMTSVVPYPSISMSGEIGTGSFFEEAHWEVLAEHDPNWLMGDGRWQGANRVPVNVPNGKLVFQPYPALSFDHLTHFILLSIVIAILLQMLFHLLQFMVQRSLLITPENAVRVVYGALTTTIIALVCLELLRFRFQESDSILLFLAPEHQTFIYSIGPLTLLLTFFIFLMPQFQSFSLTNNIRNSLGRLSIQPYFIVWLIAIVALLLRYYGLDFQDLQADENVSLDAARGILRSGIPETVSGVLYTRSPLYHYLLAAWLWLFGDTIIAARLFSVLPGILTIFVVHHLTYKITGRMYLGLIIAALIALDPWEIQMSRIIRFYQQMQLFSIISLYFFLRGFIWQEGKRYQNWFFFFCTAAVLSQEVFVITFPAFCIAAFLYYKPFNWHKDKNIWIGFTITMAITLIDMGIFNLVCLTPHVGIGTSSGSIIQLHLISPSVFFTTIFVGYQRLHILYSILFFFGILYWLFRPNKVLLTLYLMVILTTITATVLVMQVANRYLFCIYPLLIIVAVITLDTILRQTAHTIFKKSNSNQNQRLKQYWLISVLCVLTITSVLHFQPEKFISSYHTNVNIQNESAYRYIRKFGKPEDKVLSTSPPSGAIILGGIDYFLMQKLSFDEVYSTKTGIVDRWGGGHLISKPDMIRSVLQNHPRVWILIDDHEAIKLSNKVREFLLKTTSIEYEFFGGKLLLWDSSRGIHTHITYYGGSTDSF